MDGGAALVGHSVRVHVRRDQTFLSGVLLSVDPESGDAALLLPITATEPTETMGVKIVMGHAIDRIELDDTHTDRTIDSIRQDLKSSGAPLAVATAQTREELVQRLGQFLDERFIPHSTTTDHSIQVLGGAATLRFPFDAASIACTNEQILQRLQSLLTEFHELTRVPAEPASRIEARSTHQRVTNSAGQIS